MVALVALRLSIGWHFYKEGEKKWVDPDFTAAPFLVQATGPLAPMVQDFVSEGHRWRQLLAQPQAQPPGSGFNCRTTAASDDAALPLDKPYSDWAEQIISDWKAQVKQFTGQYGLDEQQTKAAVEALKARNEQLLGYLEAK